MDNLYMDLKQGDLLTIGKKSHIFNQNDSSPQANLEVKVLDIIERGVALVSVTGDSLNPPHNHVLLKINRPYHPRPGISIRNMGSRAHGRRSHISLYLHSSYEYVHQKRVLPYATTDMRIA